MLRTVDEGFRIFHSRLTPTATESEAAKRHRASIKGCLEHNFGMTRFFRIGSFGNGTSISGHSDVVHYFAVIPTDRKRESSQKMGNLALHGKGARDGERPLFTRIQLTSEEGKNENKGRRGA